MEAYKLQYFRHFICGAGPLTVDLATKFEQKFKMPIVHGYGLSETTCYSCFLPLDLTGPEHRMWMSQARISFDRRAAAREPDGDPRRGGE